jgi:hypothetical protein
MLADPIACVEIIHAPRLKEEETRRLIIDLFSMPNIAVAAHYWNIGVGNASTLAGCLLLLAAKRILPRSSPALNFLATPLAYYLVDTLGASSAQYNTFTALSYLPWCIKVLYGERSGAPFDGCA